MSKSLKNTVTISECLTKYTADEFRMLCLTSHYGNQVDFSASNMERAKSICTKINSFRSDVDACVKGQKMFSSFDSNELSTHNSEKCSGEGLNAAVIITWINGLIIQYVSAFGKLAKTNNTLILPSNAGDITSLVGQAMTIYNAVSKSRLDLKEPSPIDSSSPSDSITDIKENLQYAAQNKRDSSLLVNESHENAKLEDFPKDVK